MFTWFPSEGTLWWTIHCASTTPIFSCAGCFQAKNKGWRLNHNRKQEGAKAQRQEKNALNLYTASKRKIQTPTMDQIILQKRGKCFHASLRVIIKGLGISWKEKVYIIYLNHMPNTTPCIPRKHRGHNFYKPAHWEFMVRCYSTYVPQVDG